MSSDKIIACDFDGTLFTDAYPNIGEPIYENINALKAEQETGTQIILWTCRTGVELQEAIYACLEKDILFDAVNQNLPHIIKEFGGDQRKIFAHEYWDDRAVPKTEKGIGHFSDGYHTFNDLYKQRLILSAALFNTYKHLAWKSRRHSDGKPCFDGEWFIVGVNTAAGPYTYHYENEHWELFDIPEIETAPEWDGHTDKDVERVMHLQDEA